MLVTAIDMFKYFLDCLNKEGTGSVTPDEFNRLINNSMLECVKNKYSEFDRTQKRIDDLRILECRDEIVNTGGNVAGEEIFQLPYNPNSFVTTNGNPNGDNNGYMFLLNCGFKIQYMNNDCCETGISPKFLMSKPMKADKEYAIADDPYNRPSDKRIYHKVIGNQILCITGTQSFAIKAKIDYLRYPRLINVPTPTSSIDVACELPIHIREEIIDIAVRKKLGIIESPRYQQKIAEDSQSIT